MDHQRATPPAQQPGNYEVLFGHRLVHPISGSVKPLRLGIRVVDHPSWAVRVGKDVLHGRGVIGPEMITLVALRWTRISDHRS
jgi:hypothetical protein